MRGITFPLLALLTASCWTNSTSNTIPIVKTSTVAIKTTDETDIELNRLKSCAGNIESYAKKNKLNSEICFLVDMKLPSGNKRFFIYDLKKDSVIAAGLVAHGSGSDNAGKDLVFSNTISSNATSLGKYKIGNAYYGKFGLAYKLHGLDKTNSNAFSRFVVLHSHSCIPENEVTPLEVCRSWGCPTVAPSFLLVLKKYLDKPGKPILLHIFY